MKSRLMAISVFLFLALMIAPVIAAPATKTPFIAEASFVPISPGKQWITKDGISHVKGGISEGTITSISGPDISGAIWMSVDETVDLNTGEGSLHGKWTITAMADSYTFEGSAAGVITSTSPTTSHLSGTFIGHGTGAYEGQKIMGSFESEVTMGVYPIELNMEGIILSPKG